MNDREREEPDKGHDEGEYPDATFLYIRTNPADDGSEPLSAGLAHWQSPDIVVIKPGGARGTEAVADALNTVEVTVTNAGGMAANNAYVDAFFGNPATTMTPTTTTLIGGSFLTIPPLGTAAAAFPWTPSQTDAGHRCLMARVSLVIPPDTYVDGTIFDVKNDRHIAQRNIHVVLLQPGQDSASFAFFVLNPATDPDTEAEFVVEAKQVTDVGIGHRLIHSLSCPLTPRMADSELESLSLRIDDRRRIERPSLTRRLAIPTGPLRKPLQPTGQHETAVQLRGGQQERATVTAQLAGDARRGDVTALDVRQIDLATDSVVGGLTILLQST